MQKRAEDAFQSQQGMGSKVEAEIDWFLVGGLFILWKSGCKEHLLFLFHC